MPLSEADVAACLKTLIDPSTEKDYVSGKAVKSVRADADGVAIDIQLAYPAKSQHDSIRRQVQSAVAALPGAGKVTVNVTQKIVSHSVQRGVKLVPGPSQPMMLGIAGRPESKDGKTLEPLEAYGIQAMSIGFLIDTDTPMVWRGPMVTQAL